MRILLDSVILIDHFNGVSAATQYLKKTFEEAAISVITRAEVLAGFDENGAKAACRLLDRYRVLPVVQETADRAAALRRENRWRLPDALQAAVAQLNGLTLATRNIRDFPPGRFSFVVTPYRIG